MPERPEGETLQLRVARVEDQLWEPAVQPSDLTDDDLLVFVRVRRALYAEYHRWVFQVCAPYPSPYPPPPGE
jgi:hypothetical protein